MRVTSSIFNSLCSSNPMRVSKNGPVTNCALACRIGRSRTNNDECIIALCGSRGRRIRYRSLCYSLPCDSNTVSVRETATWNWQLCGLCDGDHLLTDRSKERSYAESRWAKSVGLPGTFVPRVGAYAKKQAATSATWHSKSRMAVGVRFRAVLPARDHQRRIVPTPSSAIVVARTGQSVHSPAP